MKETGSDPSRLLPVTFRLAEMANFEGVIVVWDAWVPTSHARARACGEASIATPEVRVDVIAIAARA